MFALKKNNVIKKAGFLNIFWLKVPFIRTESEPYSIFKANINMKVGYNNHWLPYIIDFFFNYTCLKIAFKNVDMPKELSDKEFITHAA